MIENQPKKAINEDHVEPYQSAAAFEERISIVELPESKITVPLGGKRIMAKTQTDDDYEAEAKAEATRSSALITDGDVVSTDEQNALDKVKEQRPAIGKNLRATASVGSQTKGLPFNNLEFLQSEWNMTKIQIEIANGAVSAFWIHYDNGLILFRGKSRSGRLLELADFSKGERYAILALFEGAEKVANSCGIFQDHCCDYSDRSWRQRSRRRTSHLLAFLYEQRTKPCWPSSKVHPRSEQEATLQRWCNVCQRGHQVF